MQFLVISHTEPGTSEAAVQELLPAEAVAAWRWYVDGGIRQAYLRTGPDVGAVFIVEAADARDVHQLGQNLPLVRAGLITLEIIPIGPFLAWGTLMPAATVA